jgi:hypothetical protein
MNWRAKLLSELATRCCKLCERCASEGANGRIRLVPAGRGKVYTYEFVAQLVESMAAKGLLEIRHWSDWPRPLRTARARRRLAKRFAKRKVVTMLCPRCRGSGYRETKESKFLARLAVSAGNGGLRLP